MAMHKNKLNISERLKKEIQELNDVRKKVEDKEKKLAKKLKNINDRIEYVVIKLADFYGLQVASWSYYNCTFDENNGEYYLDGYFETEMILSEDFHVCVNFFDCTDEEIDGKILISTGEYDPFMGEEHPCNSEIKFPTRWIFENFEEELKKSKILYEIGKK